MLNTLDRWYTSIQNKNPIFVKLRYYTLIRVIIRTMANVFLPLYFKLSRHRPSPEPMPNGEQRIIVSLTTFPERIKRVWLVIECLLRQTRQPDKIILWLASSQFPNKYDDLPKRLLAYRSDVFEIRFVEEDLRSHKKYFYAFVEFPNDCIVTVDDDLFYVNSLIDDLWLLHMNFPGCICCHRCSEVHKDEGKILPYKQWTKQKEAVPPTMRLFQTSGGGTLYTADMLHTELLNAGVFKKLCFQADDVWLNMMAQMQGTRTVKGIYYSEYLPIWNRSSMKLSRFNVSGGGNDQQLHALIDHYALEEASLFVHQGKR